MNELYDQTYNNIALLIFTRAEHIVHLHNRNDNTDDNNEPSPLRTGVLLIAFEYRFSSKKKKKQMSNYPLCGGTLFSIL